MRCARDVFPWTRIRLFDRRFTGEDVLDFGIESGLVAQFLDAAIRHGFQHRIAYVACKPLRPAGEHADLELRAAAEADLLRTRIARLIHHVFAEDVIGDSHG